MKAEPKNNNTNMDEESDFEAEQNMVGFFKLLLEIDQRIDPEFYKQLAKEQREEADKKLKKTPNA